ncbi:hypothetical protein [Undibacterium umbellatum]|uniref:Uncharacterized protein n=1 Tax=Undibacterium umbellatum TaxID=2762300 RepID=A0ABR6ZDM0_9BURK|nr:hypothetical protein [Undibacterium umbellatum]MBC3909734.1 hypothetical protein [Undibacterium umbellatum]
MANEIQLPQEQAFQVADGFAQLSARILDYRVTHREALSSPERASLEEAEDHLDHLVVLFRSYGIRLIGAGAADAAAEITAAISRAKATIEKVDKIKKAISTAAAIVDLAVAVFAKDPKAVLAAAKAIKGDQA